MDTKALQETLKADKQRMTPEKWRSYTTIDGNRCNPEQRCGYCWSEQHRGYLTLPLMFQHECVEKQCKHFQKYEKHSYWKGKDKAKAKKQQRKAQEKAHEQKLTEMLNIMRALTEEDNNFFPISVAKGEGLYQHQYIVRFVKFAWIDIPYYVKLFKERCGVSIYLDEIKNTYENKMRILDAQGLVRLEEEQ